MSFIGGLFSGSQGAGFQAQQGATVEQAQQLYKQQQDVLAQQRAFTEALQAQTPQAISQQQQLAQAVAQRAMGVGGPSMAQEQLAQATGQNIAGTSAALAGQRGSGANVGLTGRNIARMGAETNQQAAGQGAMLRAAEQLGAQAQLGQLTGQQLGQVQAAEQLGISGQTAAQQNVLNAINQQNAVNAQIARGNQAFQAGVTGGAMSNLPFVGKLFGATGGQVPGEDKKGFDYWQHIVENVDNPNYTPSQQFGFKGGKGLGQGLQSLLMPQAGSGIAGELGMGANLAKTVPMIANKGGKVPAMLSPGEKYLNPDEVQQVAHGTKEPLEVGKKIPGKAKVKGDSLKNDTYETELEPGGIVIPRSVVNSKNPEESARKFVAAVLAKQKSKRK